MGRLGNTIKAGQSAIELGKNVHSFAGAASEFRSTDKTDLGRKVGHHAFSEGAETGKAVGKTWLKTFEVVPRLICRGLQLLFALLACGFYGNRVSADDEADEGFSPEWIVAIVVAGLSAVTAVVFLAATPLSAIPYVGSRLKLFKTYRAFAWDLGLSIAWLVIFAVFAGIFLKRESDDPYKGSSTGAMKTAVWIDLTSAIFWLISGSYGAVKTCLGERADMLTDKVGNKLFVKKNKTEVKDTYAESV